jgi:hypothetical protein
MPLTKIQSLGITDGTIVNADINASAAIASTKLSGVGKVLQVIQTSKTDTFTTTSTSFVDITGLSASITPSSASSKILVLCDITFNITSAQGFIKLLRDSTDIYIGDSAGSRIQGKASLYSSDGNVTNSQVINFLDSPNTTSSITYKCQIKTDNASFLLAINRSQGDTDSSARVRGTSSIILMEISA